MRLYDEYVKAFDETSAAVAEADAARLGLIRRGIARLPAVVRAVSLVGFDDALCDRPRRSHMHFCRMVLKPARTTVRRPY